MASSHQSPIASFFRRPSFLHDDTHFAPNPNNAAGDFEFDESDLYFDSPGSNSKPRKKAGPRRIKASAKVAAAEEEEEASRSVPMRIPTWSAKGQSEESEGDEDEGEGRLPPHEYLARKRGASLSVHEGAGRTLKGRDMSRVRNAVWKKLGFED